MPYTPTAWNPGIAPGISAANLNNLETQHTQAINDILTVSETEVFSGTPPAAWTDLDISAVVGTNVALVLLKVGRGANDPGEVVFRKDGDTDDFFYSGSLAGHGVASADMLTNGIHTAYMVATSGLGVIEWKASNAVAGITVDVIAFVIGA